MKKIKIVFKNNIKEFQTTDKESNNYQDFRKHLKTWKSVLSCNLNIVKTKTWQDSLEILLKQSINDVTEEQILGVFEDIANFEIAIIQSTKVSFLVILKKVYIVSSNRTLLCIFLLTLMYSSSSQ